MSGRDAARAMFDDGARLQESGALSEAVAAYLKAFEADPTWTEPAVRAARCEHRLGRLTYAADGWRRVLGTDPSLHEARVGLADVLREAGCWLESLDAYDYALASRADDPRAQAGRGESLRLLGQPQLALAWFDRALRGSPDLLLAIQGKAASLNGLKLFRESLVWWDNAVSARPQSAFAAAGREEAEAGAKAIEQSGQPPSPEAQALPSGHTAEATRYAAWGTALAHDLRFREAIASFDRSLTADAQLPGVAALRAHAAAALENPTEPPLIAVDAVAEPIVALQPQIDAESPERRAARALVEQGNVQLRENKFREAADLFLAAATADAQWSLPCFLAGVALEGYRQFGRAVRSFDDAIKRDPTHLDAACRKADALRKKHDYYEALSAYDGVLWTHPDELRALLGRAETLRLLGKFADAVRWYDRAIVVRPDLLSAVVGRAASLTALRKFEDAKAAWLRALEIDPNAGYAKSGLKHCEAIMKDGGERPWRAELPGDEPAEAARNATTPEPSPTREAAPPAAVSPDPTMVARDEFDRGRSYHKDRDYANAIAAFQRALVLDPSFAEAAFRLGLAHEDDRQFRKAIEAYEQCLGIKPDHIQAATNIGEAHRKNERYKDAIKAYDRALKARPDYLYALAGRGESMRMLGDYEASLTWFDKALAVGTRHAFAIQGKAAALNALRRFKEALPLWEKALEIDPRSQFALDGKVYCETQLKTTKAEGESTSEEGDSESTTPTLDEQGRDLTALARDGKLTHVVGREHEIRSVMKTLVRRQKANPLLLGDPGVGKTAVVEGVAQVLASDDAPARLRGTRIIELSMGSLVAGTKYRGTFEERLKAIIKEAKANPGIVLFIDEIHTLVGAGRTEGGSLDAANILKPALARGEINVIGATTLAEYRKHFESDSALERRFQPITIEEPSVEATIELLEKVQKQYADHHQVTIENAALAACARLAVRFMPDRRLPDKALDLLDEACAEASLSDKNHVTADMVAQVLAERTGIPVRKLTVQERERLAAVETHLGERVVGQREPIRQVANTVRLSRAGLRDSRKPRGVFLFAGSSGVGKTELAKALADFLFPEGSALIKLDMSEYGEKFTSSRLLGAPPGYAGHGDEGQLTGPLRRRPYAVVLLDEFEKAHADVQTMFLSLFDEGVVTDAEGRKVDAREAFFVITTNAGSELTSRGRVGFGGGSDDEQRNAAVEKVRKHFRPELLNRIDEIVWFHPLEVADLQEIARMNLKLLAERAEAEGVRLTWDDAVVDLVVKTKPDPTYGARPVLRAIDDLVAESLGQLMLREEPSLDRAFRATVQDGVVHFVREQQSQENAGSPAPEQTSST